VNNPWSVIPIPVAAPDGQFGRLDELAWREKNGQGVQIQPASGVEGSFLYTDGGGNQKF
jgi:hypothetical protein